MIKFSSIAPFTLHWKLAKWCVCVCGFPFFFSPQMDNFFLYFCFCFCNHFLGVFFCFAISVYFFLLCCCNFARNVHNKWTKILLINEFQFSLLICGRITKINHFGFLLLLNHKFKNRHTYLKAKEYENKNTFHYQNTANIPHKSTLAFQQGCLENFKRFKENENYF